MNSMKYIIKYIEINREQVYPEIVDSMSEERTTSKSKYTFKHVSFAKKLSYYEPMSILNDYIDENHYKQRKSIKMWKLNFTTKFGFNFHIKGINNWRRKVIPTLPLTYNNLNQFRISNDDVN